MSERGLRTLGWLATLTAVAMYASYVDVIAMNLAGRKGSLIPPAATVINCALWCSYGFFRPKREWPIVAANLPGVVLGAIAFATAL